MPCVSNKMSDLRYPQIGLEGRRACSRLLCDYLPGLLKVDEVTVWWDQPFEWQSSANADELVVRIDGDVELTVRQRQEVVQSVVRHLITNWGQLPMEMTFAVWLVTPNGNAWASGTRSSSCSNFVDEGPRVLLQ